MKLELELGNDVVDLFEKLLVLFQRLVPSLSIGRHSRHTPVVFGLFQLGIDQRITALGIDQQKRALLPAVGHDFVKPECRRRGGSPLLACRLRFAPPSAGLKAIDCSVPGCLPGVTWTSFGILKVLPVRGTISTVGADEGLKLLCALDVLRRGCRWLFGIGLFGRLGRGRPGRCKGEHRCRPKRSPWRKSGDGG